MPTSIEAGAIVTDRMSLQFLLLQVRNSLNTVSSKLLFFWKLPTRAIFQRKFCFVSIRPQLIIRNLRNMVLALFYKEFLKAMR